jgi:hypothetical protein
MDATVRIKNLSIALEALSRVAISGERNSLFERVHDLLEDTLKEEETKLPPSARPAYTTFDDSIPF